MRLFHSIVFTTWAWFWVWYMMFAVWCVAKIQFFDSLLSVQKFREIDDFCDRLKMLRIRALSTIHFENYNKNWLISLQNHAQVVKHVVLHTFNMRSKSITINVRCRDLCKVWKWVKNRLFHVPEEKVQNRRTDQNFAMHSILVAHTVDEEWSQSYSFATVSSNYCNYAWAVCIARNDWRRSWFWWFTFIDSHLSNSSSCYRSSLHRWYSR